MNKLSCRYSCPLEVSLQFNPSWDHPLLEVFSLFFIQPFCWRWDLEAVKTCLYVIGRSDQWIFLKFSFWNIVVEAVFCWHAFMSAGDCTYFKLPNLHLETPNYDGKAEFMNVKIRERRSRHYFPFKIDLIWRKSYFPSRNETEK